MFGTLIVKFFYVVGVVAADADNLDIRYELAVRSIGVGRFGPTFRQFCLIAAKVAILYDCCDITIQSTKEGRDL